MIVIPYYLIDLLCPGYSQQEFQDVPPANREESQEQRPVFNSFSIILRSSVFSTLSILGCSIFE